MTSDYTGLLRKSSLPLYYRRFSSFSCDNTIFGCTQKFSALEDRQKHKLLCDFDPKGTIKCNNCQIQMQRSQFKRHNCIKELRISLDELKDVIIALEEKVNQQMVCMHNAKQILHTSAPVLTPQTDYSDQYKTGDEESDQVFESEPQIDFKETERQVSESSDIPALEGVSSYKRFNKQFSKDAEFGMYGSLKYKYLSQLSREFSGDLPPVDYDLDLQKKNKEQLVDVFKDNETFNQKPSLVRLRAWTERD